MAVMTVQGNLSVRMAGLVSVFNGATLTNKYDTGTFLMVYNYPEVVNLYGQDLRVPGSGPSFITGLIDEFSYEEISLSPFSSTEKLVLSGLSVQGASVFDLMARTTTTATGRFDVDRFEAMLQGESWAINGSPDNDNIAPGFYFQLAGNETIATGAGADEVLAGAGDDHVSAGGGNDVIHGDDGNDVLLGGNGKDVLNGGVGNDRLVAGKGHDKLLGGAGDDVLSGGSGRDVLRGQKGDDVLSGGEGGDRFLFKRGDGNDVIHQFDANADHIVIGRGASKFSKLSVTQSGDDVEIGFANVTITLRDFDAGDVMADLFVF